MCAVAAHVFYVFDTGAGVVPGNVYTVVVVDEDLILCGAEIYAEQRSARPD
jgi:hypothetical protein